MGGVLFAFSDFVMTALAHQPVGSAVRTMQTINIDILNPLFFLLFFGTPAFSLALGAVAILRAPGRGKSLLLAGATLYLLGTFGVTLVFNIPLNDRLSVLNPESDAAASYWPTYFSDWMRWNHVRTVSAAAACLCLMLAAHQLENAGDSRS